LLREFGVTGIVIAGEALALLVGMHVLSTGDSPWISLKNDLLSVLDILAGVGLVIVVAMNRDIYASGIFYVLVFIAVVAHGYREWEYLVRAVNAFCANAPLFAVNNFKLSGLLVIVVDAVIKIASKS
jgi:hypothetical protein